LLGPVAARATDAGLVPAKGGDPVAGKMLAQRRV
jgi:hypothetical protein